MFKEELDEISDKEWRGGSPNKNWTEEDWIEYGRFLFESYNREKPIPSYPENDEED